MKRKIIFAALGISLAAALFSSMIAAAACRAMRDDGTIEKTEGGSAWYT